MNTYRCAYCNIVFSRYSSQVKNPSRVFCSRKCKDLYQKQHNLGINNPNYKNGAYANPRCECGEQKDPRSLLCSKCAHKGYPVGHPDIDQDFWKQTIKNSTSILEASKILGRSRKFVSEMIKRLQINIDHFKGSAYRQTPHSILFVRGNSRRNGTIKSRLLRDNLVENQCAACGLRPYWNNQQLVLELDHINGDATDNRLSNLRLLCPNCHSQTNTNKGKNSRGVKKKRRKD